MRDCDEDRTVPLCDGLEPRFRRTPEAWSSKTALWAA